MRNEAIQKTIEAYNKIAEEYCKKTEKEGDRDFQTKMLDRTLDLLRTQPKPRVIDLGCGDGRDTHYLKKNGADVVGIDLSRNMIQLARKKYSENAFIHSDMRDTVFPEDTFHGAWASASLTNIPKEELSSVEKEVYRILETDSIFGFSFKIGEGERFEESVIEGYDRLQVYYTLEELKSELDLFRIIRTEKYPGTIFDEEFMYCWAEAR